MMHPDYRIKFYLPSSRASPLFECLEIGVLRSLNGKALLTQGSAQNGKSSKDLNNGYIKQQEYEHYNFTLR